MAANPSMTTPAKAAIYRDPRYRALFYQIVLVALVVFAAWYLFTNTQTNMEKRGIPTGFEILDNPAGFGINFKLITYTETSSYWAVYVVGVLNTLFVSFIGVILATIIGFAVGVARLSPNWLLSKLAGAYVEIFRNVPLLLQILFWYKAVLVALPSPRQSISFFDSIFINNRGVYIPDAAPLTGAYVVGVLFLLGVVATIVISRWARKRQEATGEQFPAFATGLALILGVPIAAFLIIWALVGVPFTFDVPKLTGFNFTGGVSLIPEFFAILLALVIYTGAYIAEVVRSGILAVSHGQTEAAYALGLRPRPTLKLIIIPQALRVIIPPLTNQYLNLTKNSSLAVAIAYPDLTAVFVGTALNQTGAAVQMVGIAMLTYLSFSLLTSGIMNWYNARKALVER